MSSYRSWPRPLLTVVLILGALISGCSKSSHTVAPEPDSDGDGVVDSRDQCPQLAGDPSLNGCPWYKVDVCSTDRPYALAGDKWGNMSPAFYISTSVPLAWRAYVGLAASQWNSAGSRLHIVQASRLVTNGAALDGTSVVSYAPLSDPSRLAETSVWYNTTTRLISEADIVINSNQPFGTDGSDSYFDLYATLVHEFGHFCGLDHVMVHTQTMYPAMPKGSIIFRTLCGGDQLGVDRLYP
jgi:hypothetical protein